MLLVYVFTILYYTLSYSRRYPCLKKVTVKQYCMLPWQQSHASPVYKNLIEWLTYIIWVCVR